MTENSARILIVDDEQPIRKLLRVGLTAEGFAVLEARNAQEAATSMKTDGPDLVVLDLGLPDKPGSALLADWRGAGNTVPVLILSSRTDEKGIVEALETGADDYVTKPFGVKELAARIRVALRHRLHDKGESPVFVTGDLSVDLVRRIVRVAGKEVRLTPREYEMLRLLVSHAGKVITHRMLLHEVWGESQDVQYLRVYIRQLRQKLGDTPEEPKYITTETGVGYRMREADQIYRGL